MFAKLTGSLALLGVLALAACGAPSDVPAGPATSSVEAALASVAAGAPAPLVPILNWKPCNGDLRGFECATASVPLDYAEPLGAQTSIALARVPARDPARRIGSLFLNTGGPGLTGFVMLRNWGSWFADLTQGRYDVVSFDPRGVGASEAVQCFQNNVQEAKWVASPLNVFPIRDEEERPYYDYNLTWYADACLSSQSRILHHMSTADVARDLELLRQAVGDARLNLVAVSYGTFLGQTYANLFPERVGAFILDAVIDPRTLVAGHHWSRSFPVSVQAEFGEFLRLCDEAGQALCPLTTPAIKAAERHQALLAALRLAPYQSPTGPVTYQDVVLAHHYPMFDPLVWRDLAAWLGALADAVTGVPGATSREAALRPAALGKAGGAGDRQGHGSYVNFDDASYATACGDAEYPSSFEDWAAEGDLVASVSFFTFNWWNMAVCANWPVSAARYTGPWSTGTATPVLLIGNYFDGITGYDGAVAASQLLEGSRLLTYAGWGHLALRWTPCIDELAGRYLRDGTLPPEGTVCPPLPNPFLP